MCHSPDNCWLHKQKRYVGDPEAHAETVADLVLQQDHYYNRMNIPNEEFGVRQKRQDRGSISRNVLILIDSSGSIEDQTFAEIKEHLIELIYLLCGNVSIGVMTYSTEIELVLCPTCYRSDSITTSEYLAKVEYQINATRHHNRYTHTGEAIACLRCSILKSATCVDSSKPTEVIIFTDGIHNGCKDPKMEVSNFVTDWSSVPIYAIGMGSIDRNGVTDLYGGTRNPNSIFNVRNITVFRQVLEEIVGVLVNTSGSCTVASHSEQEVTKLLQDN